MTLLSGCLPSELPDIPISDCPDNIGQIQKIILAHTKTAAGVKQVHFDPNAAVSPKDPSLLAPWTTKLAASDETKVVQSPWISEPVSEAGAARTYGGGNATINGVLMKLGQEPQSFEGKLLSLKLDYNNNTVEQLEAYQKGSGAGVSSLGVFLINEAGQIVMDSNGLASDAEGLELYPIPVHMFHIGDRTLGGLEAPDHNPIAWQFAPKWSKNLVVVTPSDFDALSQLINT